MTDLWQYQYKVCRLSTIHDFTVDVYKRQEGKRSALPHSRVMIHQPMGGAQGQASDIEITAREIQKLKKELYTIIADHSHTDFDKVWADSDRDYWMTAQEAKE